MIEKLSNIILWVAIAPLGVAIFLATCYNLYLLWQYCIAPWL